MSHAHHHCQHTLAFCGTCDVAYCTKCSKQWGSNYRVWYQPTTTWPYTVTSGGSTTVASTQFAHAH